MSTNPATEAARRALSRTTDGMNQASRRRVAETAAREALKPIRDIHKPVDYLDPDDGSYEFTCGQCNVLWPCETGKLIYSSEELGR